MHLNIYAGIFNPFDQMKPMCVRNLGVLLIIGCEKTNVWEGIQRVRERKKDGARGEWMVCV